MTAADDLVFLFGMPRSGTTWIGKVFDSHPEVAYRHEPDTQFGLHAEMPLLPEVDRQAEFAAVLEEFVRSKLVRCSSRTCGKRPHFAKSGESDWRRFAGLARLELARIAERLLQREVSWPVPVTQKRIAWKSVESLGRLGVLSHLYPESHGVLIIRDPRGYAASIMKGEQAGNFSGKHTIAEDWQLFEFLCDTRYARDRGITYDWVRNQSPVRRLAWLWLLFNQKAILDVLYASNVTIVRYEDLCLDPLGGFKALFQFCGLDWVTQTNDFVALSTAHNDDAYYSVFKNPTESAFKWRKKLGQTDQEQIADVVQTHLAGTLYFGEVDPRLHPRLTHYAPQS